MEFVQNAKGHSKKDEEDDERDDEEAGQMGNYACDFFSHQSQSHSQDHTTNSRSGSKLVTTYSEDDEEAINNFHGKSKLVDLSLRIDTTNGSIADGGSSRSNNGSLMEAREHMFDKVVTPSDVGKLNRLVIPKQHAEKFFPLDSSTTEKGLILNFEDRNGRPWRFRYSYWNSSQSYVMTKGWSRFVKDKKLDPGDIVSFHRGLGQLGKPQFYIDWRRRPDAPPARNHYFTNSNPFLLRRTQHQHHHQYYLHQDPHMNYSNIGYPIPNYSYSSLNQGTTSTNTTNNSLYYLRPLISSHKMGTMQRVGRENEADSLTPTPTPSPTPMVIDSVPVFSCNKTTKTANNTNTAATVSKQLRLFGVNMVECPPTATTDDDREEEAHDPLPLHHTNIQTDPDHQFSRSGNGKQPLFFNWDTA